MRDWRRVGLFALLCVLLPSTAWAAIPTFTTKAFPNALSGNRAVLLADFDGDGLVDLFTMADPGSAEFFLNPGDAGPWPLSYSSTGFDYSWTAADAGDVDGDGDIDVVACSWTAADGIVVFVNDGSGNFTEVPYLKGCNDVKFVEWGDGGELEVAYLDSTLSRLRAADYNGGTLVAYPDYDFDNSEPSHVLAPVDVNGDAFTDIYVGSSTVGTIQLVMNTEPAAPGLTSGGFMSTYMTAAASRFLFAEAGLPHVVFATTSGGVYVATDIMRSSWFSVASSCGSMSANDFDLDGTHDLALECGAEVWVNDFLADRPMSSGEQSVYSGVGNIHSIATGDLDGDGDIDILVADTAELTQLLNDTIMLPATEICDGIDNDSNGIVDDAPADADCPMGEECHWGVCFQTCSTSSECTAMGFEGCYQNDGRCDDPTDPCYSVAANCAADEICFGGSCFTECTDDAACDPLNEACYRSQNCRDKDDPCRDVQCLAEEICYGGGCFVPCGGDVDCSALSPSHRCWDGRCAVDPCDDVDCKWNQVCYGGSCFTPCFTDAECGTQTCYIPTGETSGRCAYDACEGVQCSEFETCFGGSCFPDCDPATACMEMGTACYRDYCLDDSDPCVNAQCGTEEVCFGGTCFSDCNPPADVCDPDSICWNGRCTDPDNPWCSGFLCPDNEACYRSKCFPDCVLQAECDADEICYDGACVPTDCSETTCEAGEDCVNGVCLTACSDDSNCASGETCWPNGFCGATACDAFDQATIDAYDASHGFHAIGRRLHSSQYSTPWIWPRPVIGASGVDFATWAATANVHAVNKARVVFYLDDTLSDGQNPLGKYVVWLVHGRNNPSQGDSEVVYSLRFKDWSDEPGVVYNPTNEAEFKWENGGTVHHQAFLTNGPTQAGGMAFGPFASAQDEWEIQVMIALGGDLAAWEMYDAENDVGYPLDPAEPLKIQNPEFTASEEINPETGTPCQVPGAEGICEIGTYSICRNGKLLCDQTVSPWAFEICDGKDNTCNGYVDGADPDFDLTVPTVYQKQAAFGSWQMMPTIDRNQRISDAMNYTANGDEKKGSTDFKDVTGASLQQTGTTFMVAHRNYGDGQISIPILHSKLISVSDEANAFGEHDLEMRLWSPAGHNFDEFFVAWYDDRYPGGNGDDRLVENFSVPDDFRIIHHLEQYTVVGQNVESDSAVIRPVWLEGQTARTTQFNIAYEVSDAAMTWKVHLPRITDREFDKQESARFMIQAQRIDESICIAGSADDGCWLGRYQCVAGALQCGSADSTLCEGSACVDDDDDGSGGYDPTLCPAGGDCNDFDPKIYPGAPERCNGIDDDCDTLIDGVLDGMAICGRDSCGPAECNAIFACICSDGPEDPTDPPSVPCVCGESLSP